MYRSTFFFFEGMYFYWMGAFSGCWEHFFFRILGASSFSCTLSLLDDHYLLVVSTGISGSQHTFGRVRELLAQRRSVLERLDDTQFRAVVSHEQSHTTLDIRSLQLDTMSDLWVARDLYVQTVRSSLVVVPIHGDVNVR